MAKAMSRAVRFGARILSAQKLRGLRIVFSAGSIERCNQQQCADHNRKVGQVEIGAPITLPFERQNGIRTSIDTTLDAPSEMHPKEGKFWVGYGIDESAYEVLSFANEVIIFATKWHDPDFGLLPCQAADAITMQSGTIDHISRCKRSAAGL